MTEEKSNQGVSKTLTIASVFNTIILGICGALLWWYVLTDISWKNDASENIKDNTEAHWQLKYENKLTDTLQDIRINQNKDDIGTVKIEVKALKESNILKMGGN